MTRLNIWATRPNGVGGCGPEIGVTRMRIQGRSQCSSFVVLTGNTVSDNMGVPRTSFFLSVLYYRDHPDCNCSVECWQSPININLNESEKGRPRPAGSS